jgi:chemotaxis protein methyltransferase CheR
MFLEESNRAHEGELYRMPAPLSRKTFSRLAAFIHAELGIKMPELKMTMLQGRLQKRLRHLGMVSYDEYADYLLSAEGIDRELPHLTNAVTTNKTDFFREPNHFDILVREALPKLTRPHADGVKRNINVWSAACSTGEEPFTLAMVLSEFSERHPGFHFSILATDISTRVLEKAVTGIYAEECVQPVPIALRRKFFLKGKADRKGLVRIAPELRSMVKFKRLNLMDEDYGIREAIDVIFCRNVIIYFDRPTQEKVLNSLTRHLRPGGFIFMGHSETLNGIDLPVEPFALTVYRKIG